MWFMSECLHREEVKGTERVAVGHNVTYQCVSGIEATFTIYLNGTLITDGTSDLLAFTPNVRVSLTLKTQTVC